MNAYDRAAAALEALRRYERECDDRRRVESQRIYRHQGAFVPGCAPTTEGRIGAMAKAFA